MKTQYLLCSVLLAIQLKAERKGQRSEVKCLPLATHLEVIGVAELVNKMNGPWFNRFDEDLATAFSIYCGISIAHVRPASLCLFVCLFLVVLPGGVYKVVTTCISPNVEEWRFLNLFLCDPAEH